MMADGDQNYYQNNQDPDLSEYERNFGGGGGTLNNDEERRRIAEKEQKQHLDSSSGITLSLGAINRQLIVPKLFYFFFYAACGSIFPLIGIYFKQLGLSPAQAGFLIGIRPFVEFVSGPFWGRFHDKFRKAKYFLIGSIGCWIIFTVAMSFVHPQTKYCLARHTYGNGSAVVIAGDPKIRSKRSIHQPPHLFNTPNQSSLLLNKVNVRSKRQTGGFVENTHAYIHGKYMPPGFNPQSIDIKTVANYDKSMGDLVRPRVSTKIFSRSSVEEVFLLMFLIVVLGEFFSAPAIQIADAATVNHLGDRPEDFHRQRLFGSGGWAIAMFIIGFSLDYAKVFPEKIYCDSLETREKNYALCFASFAVLMICALITATQFHIKEEEKRPDQIHKVVMDSEETFVAPAIAEKARARGPEPQEAAKGPKWLSVLKTFHSPHYICFIFTCFWMGFGIGMVFAFLFWHLQDLGGGPALFGIASVVNHISEIGAFTFSFRLINKFGHIKVLYMGLAANVIRFIFIALLVEPWWILPFEFFQGLTHAAVWSTASSYMSLCAVGPMRSQSQGFIRALHHGVGKGCGALISGLIITYQGTKIMFLIYGIGSLIILVVFFVINRFYKIEGVKYEASELLENTEALAPHGIPMNVPYSLSGEGYQDLNASASLYQSEPDPTQDAYDRYIHEPYDKPVKFESIPSNIR